MPSSFAFLLAKTAPPTLATALPTPTAVPATAPTSVPAPGTTEQAIAPATAAPPIDVPTPAATSPTDECSPVFAFLAARSIFVQPLKAACAVSTESGIFGTVSKSLLPSKE